MKAGANKAKTKTLVVKSDDPTARDATPEERIARHVATVATVQAPSGWNMSLRTAPTAPGPRAETDRHLNAVQSA